MSLTNAVSGWYNRYEEEFQGTLLVTGCKSNGIQKQQFPSHQWLPGEKIEGKYLI